MCRTEPTSMKENEERYVAAVPIHILPPEFPKLVELVLQITNLWKPGISQRNTASVHHRTSISALSLKELLTVLKAPLLTINQSICTV